MFRFNESIPDQKSKNLVTDSSQINTENEMKTYAFESLRVLRIIINYSLKKRSNELSYELPASVASKILASLNL